MGLLVGELLPAAPPSCDLSPLEPRGSPPRAHVRAANGFGSGRDSAQPAEIPFPFCLQFWQAHSSVLTILGSARPGTADRLANVSASSCARHTVRSNKPKHQSMEQRKVYCRAMQGDRWLMPPKKPKLLEGFWQIIFKSQVREWCRRVCDHLVHSSLIG